MTKHSKNQLKMAQPSTAIVTVILFLNIANTFSFASADDDALDTITTTEFGLYIQLQTCNAA